MTVNPDAEIEAALLELVQEGVEFLKAQGYVNLAHDQPLAFYRERAHRDRQYIDVFIDVDDPSEVVVVAEHHRGRRLRLATVSMSDWEARAKLGDPYLGWHLVGMMKFAAYKMMRSR